MRRATNAAAAVALAAALSCAASAGAIYIQDVPGGGGVGGFRDEAAAAAEDGFRPEVYYRPISHGRMVTVSPNWEVMGPDISTEKLDKIRQLREQLEMLEDYLCVNLDYNPATCKAVRHHLDRMNNIGHLLKLARRMMQSKNKEKT